MSNKNPDYYKKLDYNVIIKHEKDGDDEWYVAYCEEFGLYACHGRGETPAEAFDGFQKEKDAFITYLHQEGKFIPEPAADTEYGSSGVFTVRTSPWLHAQLAKQAKKFDMSLNSYVNQIISYGVGCNEVLSKAEYHFEAVLREINSLCYGRIPDMPAETRNRERSDKYGYIPYIPAA